MRLVAEIIGWIVIGSSTLCILLMLGMIIYDQVDNDLWEWRRKKAKKKLQKELTKLKQ